MGYLVEVVDLLVVLDIDTNQDHAVHLNNDVHAKLSSIQNKNKHDSNEKRRFDSCFEHTFCRT
jgi:hypothetical protein